MLRKNALMQGPPLIDVIRLSNICLGYASATLPIG